MGISAALPVYAVPADDLSTPTGGQAFFWAVLSVFVLWRLWRGSFGAWLFAAVVDLLGLVALFLMAPEVGLTPFVMIAYAVAHLMILFSSPVRAHVRSTARTRPVAT